MEPNPKFTPTIRSQADLEEAWRTLMQPLGFGGQSLWVMFVGPDDRPVPQLMEISECDSPPDSEDLDRFVTFLEHFAEDGPGGRVAFLRTRPGRDGVRGDDRAWAVGLYAACRSAGVRAEVVHLANDVRIVPIPLDELPVAAAG